MWHGYVDMWNVLICARTGQPPPFYCTVHQSRLLSHCAGGQLVQMGHRRRALVDQSHFLPVKCLWSDAHHHIRLWAIATAGTIRTLFQTMRHITALRTSGIAGHTIQVDSCYVLLCDWLSCIGNSSLKMNCCNVNSSFHQGPYTSLHSFFLWTRE